MTTNSHKIEATHGKHEKEYPKAYRTWDVLSAASALCAKWKQHAHMWTVDLRPHDGKALAPSHLHTNNMYAKGNSTFLLVTVHFDKF